MGTLPTQDLEAVLFGDVGLTVESYFSYCSSGIAKFNRDNVLVLGPVSIPCRCGTVRYKRRYSRTSVTGTDTGTGRVGFY